METTNDECQYIFNSIAITTQKFTLSDEDGTSKTTACAKQLSHNTFLVSSRVREIMFFHVIQYVFSQTIFLGGVVNNCP